MFWRLMFLNFVHPLKVECKTLTLAFVEWLIGNLTVFNSKQFSKAEVPIVNSSIESSKTIDSIFVEQKA